MLELAVINSVRRIGIINRVRELFARRRMQTAGIATVSPIAFLLSVRVLFFAVFRLRLCECSLLDQLYTRPRLYVSYLTSIFSLLRVFILGFAPHLTRQIGYLVLFSFYSAVKCTVSRVFTA